MELRQLEYFMAIAKFGGFRRAAKELGLSQATISEKIRQLEVELRVPLFERNSRHLSLTVAGQALVERADRILVEMRAVREEMTEFADLDRGYVAVGVQAPSGLVSWMPKLLAAFTARYSHVQLTLFERTNRQLVTSMRDGEIHVAWLIVPDVGEVDTEGLILQRLFSRELVFVVPSNHHLAHQDTITLEELAGEPLILPRIGEPTRTILDGVFRTQGVEPNIRCEVTDPITLVQLAAEGLGVAVSSVTLARRSGTDVHTLRLEGHHMTYSSCLAWTERGARTKAVAAFVDFAREWQSEAISEVVGPWEPVTASAEIATPRLLRAR